MNCERSEKPRECVGCPMEGILCGNPLYCFVRLCRIEAEEADKEIKSTQ